MAEVKDFCDDFADEPSEKAICHQQKDKPQATKSDVKISGTF